MLIPVAISAIQYIHMLGIASQWLLFPIMLIWCVHFVKVWIEILARPIHIQYIYKWNLNTCSLACKKSAHYLFYSGLSEGESIQSGMLKLLFWNWKTREPQGEVQREGHLVHKEKLLITTATVVLFKVLKNLLFCII